MLLFCAAIRANVLTLLGCMQWCSHLQQPPGLPGGPGHRLLNAEAPCAPCFLRECPVDFRCMTGISVERVQSLQKAAELRYGRIPQLEATLQAQEARLQEVQRNARYLKEEVDADDIAEIVAAWTGIPVARLMEGELEKLVHMQERLHDRVVGQDEAIEAVADAVRRARAGLGDPRWFALALLPAGVQPHPDHQVETWEQRQHFLRPADPEASRGRELVAVADL